MQIATSKVFPYLRPLGVAVKGLTANLRGYARRISRPLDNPDGVQDLEKRDQWTDRLGQQDHKDLEHFGRMW